MLSKILLCLLISTPCFAQVVYNGTPEQQKTGIYQSAPVMKADPKDSIVTEVKTKVDDFEVKTCVEYDDGECKPSRHFITTIVEAI